MDFTNEQYISKGGFGTVSRYHHRKRGYVAVKILYSQHKFDNASTLYSLQCEIKTWATAKHPNILPFLGVCVCRHDIGIVSCWAENGELLSYLKRYPTANRTAMLVEVASAVNYLHSISIIHGDLKANNVLVNAEGHAWLADFGLSEVLTDVDPTAFASSNSGKGCWFIAPELYEEDAHRSRETDVFSFGFLIAEVCCEKQPMPHIKSHCQAIMAIWRGARPARLEFTSEQHNDLLWRVATQCWDQDPLLRSPMSQIEEWLRCG